MRLARLSAYRRANRPDRGFGDAQAAKYPAGRAPPADIDFGLTAPAGIQYLGACASALREKREGRMGGPGARTSTDRPY